MPSAAANIASLVAAGHTVRGLERALGLSTGYLSKVRHELARPSPQLVALLEVLQVHPETLATVREATRYSRMPAAPRRPRSRATGLALEALLAMAPTLNEAGIRWALCGGAALRILCRAAPKTPGVDIVVDDRDRHVLELLRAAGYALAHHPPWMSICRLPTAVPNESIRIHFPSTAPLTTALDAVVTRPVAGQDVPVVELVTLTLANLLSQRTGADEAVAIAVAAGVSTEALAARLAVLDALPETKSLYVLRQFDRALAHRRLAAMGVG